MNEKKIINPAGAEFKPEESSSLSPAAQQAAYELANAHCLPETRRNANLALLLTELLSADSMAQKFEAAMASAPPVVDIQTGIGLKPGDPEHCWGRGYYYPDFEWSCNKCQHHSACFPKATPHAAK